MLDFDCVSGSYILAGSKLVDESGKFYALDVTPLAINIVKNLVEKKGLKNVDTIHSDCATVLRNESVDVVLLYDAFHNLENQNAVLEELHRVIKQEGILSFSDYNLKEFDILSRLTDGNCSGY